MDNHSVAEELRALYAQARDELNVRNAAAGVQWAKDHPKEVVKNPAKGAAASAAAHRAEAK